MTKNLSEDIDKNNYYLIFLLILITASILLKSIFDENGYLPSDANNYLALAQNLIENGNFYVYSGLGPEKTFYAIWPVGYSIFILIIAKITGLSVFWASKALNILLISIILIYFKYIFKRNAYAYGAVLLFASFLEIFSSSLSEAPFIALLIIFAGSIHIVTQEIKPTFAQYITLFVSSILLFLTRYIGAFSFILLALFGFFFLVKKEHGKGFIFMLGSAVCAATAFAYLYHNFAVTGYFTGMPRIPAPESSFELIKSLIEAVIQQFIPYVVRNTKGNILFLAIYPALLFFIIKNKKDVFRDGDDHNTLAAIFFIVGMSYFFALAALRWTSHFDNFCYRLLAPASILIFIAAINLIETSITTQYFNRFKQLLLVIGCFSWCFDVPYRTFTDYKTPLFAEKISSLQKDYSAVASGDIVVFGPVNLQFLRTDLILASPFTRPYASYNEKWSDFIGRINPQKNKQVYLAKIDDTSLEKYDQTVKDFVNGHKQDTLIKLP